MAEVGKMMAAAREKSNFKQTCSLLSQYLKEKGSFADLRLGMACGFGEQQGMALVLVCFKFFDFLRFPMSVKLPVLEIVNEAVLWWRLCCRCGDHHGFAAQD